MDSNLLIDKLNENTNFEYNFELKSACLDKQADFCVAEILYRDGILLTKEKKQEFEKFMLDILPKKYKYEFKFIKKFINAESLKESLENYIKKNFPSIAFKLSEVSKEDNLFKIKLIVDELSYDYAKDRGLENNILAFCGNSYENFEFECDIQKSNIIDAEEQDENRKFIDFEPNMDELRFIEVSELQEFIGDKLETKALYIKDQQSVADNILLCGTVKGIKPIIIKPKAKNNSDDDKSEKKTKNLGERKLYKWVLQDFTGDITCTFMSNKQNQPKLDTLQSGAEIIVLGSVVEDKFNDGFSMNVKTINLCKLPEKFEEQIVYHKEKPYYEFVKPEKIVTYEQNNLLDVVTEEVNEFLDGKTFVCYDLETTGISYNSGDRMIELGAVKIENGKITENFESLVCPNGRHISEGASATNGFTDMDVVDAPKDYQVLQDFYKFTRGATLIGYNNNGFDDIFLVGQGKSCRWNFDNPTMDVLKLAREHIRGLKNYKLETVAKHLGVVNEKAHRAWYDAMATAEVFIKLTKLMKK